jgi:hypothetical protein
MQVHQIRGLTQAAATGYRTSLQHTDPRPVEPPLLHRSFGQTPHDVAAKAAATAPGLGLGLQEGQIPPMAQQRSVVLGSQSWTAACRCSCSGRTTCLPAQSCTATPTRQGAD